jgi:hypothetical protein
MGKGTTDALVKSRVHPSIPQGERFTAHVIVSFSVRGERFDLAHRPERAEGVSNHERKTTGKLFMTSSTIGYP